MRHLNRISLPTVAVSFLLLVLGISGAWYVLWLQRSNSLILDLNVSSIRAAADMESGVRDMRHGLDRFLSTKDRKFLHDALTKERVTIDGLQEARKLSTTEIENHLLTEIQNGLDEFLVQLRKVVEAPIEEIETETDTINGLVDEVTENVLVYVREYMDFNEQELIVSNEQNKTMAKRLALGSLLLATCGAIAGLVAGYGVARGISRSIFNLSVPIRDVAGKLNEVVGPIAVSADPSVTDLETILQTVSSRVETVVEQLQARHREVIRADQLAAIGQLAAGLAHELRNPLMCIKTLVQAAGRDGKSAEFDARDLAVLDEEITRLENLLQAFMDFARPAKLETHDVDLGHIIRQTVSLLSAKADVREISIDCRLENEPMLVRADPNQLRQVLLNLLLNSLEAVQNGGKIWVEVVRDGSELASFEGAVRVLPRICLSVADNGRGLPTDDPTRVYEPFFSTKETGLGLGLAVSQRIVVAHGGEIEARDRNGGGTIFEVRLPMGSHR